MSKPEFVHLHNHSEYSLLDGVIRLSDKNGGPSELLKSLADNHTRGIALTDHGNMYGAIEFYNHCRRVGLNPIVGCEMYIAKGSRTDRGHSQKENCHLTVLARNFEGYQNLMELASKGFIEGYYYDPRIDKELLQKHSKGLVVLSGCLKSELNQLLLGGNLSEAEKLACWYRDILEPEAFYLEIMNHGLDKQRQVLKSLLELHDRTDIPLVATNDCHYAHKTDCDAHDARVCIATGRKLADADRLKFETHEFYVKTPAQMHELFSFAPESLKNTLRIAEMCHLKIPMDQMLLPEFAVPAGYTQDAYLEELCIKGLKVRFSGEIPTAHRERLEYELSVIRKMGYSGYFLIVWDFIAYARREGIPVGPGRGSGAGSLVAYALQITGADPLKHNLLFERFLNPDRKSMPDLDIDFADTGRDRVIEYVRNKYGAANVAQIITFGSMAARLAVRDVGRVMGIALAEVDRIAKIIPAGPGTTLYETMQKSPEMIEAAKDPQIKKLLELSLKLEGLKRHTGVHAAGTVITKEPVVKYTPLAKGSKSEVVTTQYDGDMLPRLGLLKVDFLGLRTLSIIDDAIKSIRARHDPEFDIGAIPINDAKTFELLRSGKALAVFQLDSQGMRDLLFRLKPTDFNDIVSLLALFRPGPMQSGMLDMFVERKHGKKKIAYDHALLEPILKDTYGCIVFQEQVMEIAKKLADFRPGQADGLRKAMGKKIPEELEKMRDTFITGAANHKIAPHLANKIYDQLVQFGGYGFNRSHSVAYGLIAYQTAYLKANYPIEFMAAVASCEIGHSTIGAADKENKLVTYLEEARHMGITVRAPDIQKSAARFSIEDPNSIRFGLVAVKNVGSGAVESILAVRSEKSFSNFNDFCARVDLRAANKKVIESLVKAGALDSLERSGDSTPSVALRRARLLSKLDETVDRQARLRDDLSRGQGLLFSSDAALAETLAENVSVPPLSDHDVLKFEKEVLGFYFSGHPLVDVKDKLKAVSTHEIASLSSDIQGLVRVAGMINQVKRMVTKSKGEQWARATLEDLSGEIALLIFPRAYASGLSRQLAPGSISSVSGRLSFRGEGPEAEPELIVDEIQPLDMALIRFGRKLYLAGASGLEEDALQRLRQAMDRHPGNCPVFLDHETPEGTAVLELDQRVRLDENLLESIETILGEKSWRIESAS
ncbi:MAG: DNA polymerase III subunit alpha [Elusimicrobia bacterium RIFCSPHIGHO2_02_FULL_57_9]|nr:MAG: DNA polymerase III subunit alpha [Elusimicrobia bacterium RIFCSPHIGHO2_02_FULL_57_9]